MKLFVIITLKNGQSHTIIQFKTEIIDGGMNEILRQQNKTA